MLAEFEKRSAKTSVQPRHLQRALETARDVTRQGGAGANEHDVGDVDAEAARETSGKIGSIAIPEHTPARPRERRATFAGMK